MIECLKNKETSMADSDTFLKIHNSYPDFRIRLALKYITSDNDIDVTDINRLFYASAKISTISCGEKIRKQQLSPQKPTWQERIQHLFQLLR